MSIGNRIAIVTGVTSGIGRATVERLLNQGVRIVGNARGAKALAELAEWSTEKPGTFVPVAGDIAQPDTASQLVAACKEAFGAAPCIGMVNAG